ncbi:MAG: VWA domain-containing protein [Phycisphaerales bacterium]|jgi:Ca-activated chloride channel family protein|nr:VWA domain-containing protein [Phycisphaerales bacterium]
MSRLATSNLQPRFERAIGPTRRGWRGGLLVIAMIAIVGALLDPRVGVRYEQVAQRNIDVVFALDTSRSMLAEDLRPNRLARAKQYIDDVVDQAVGDRFGIVVFGGVPTLKVPLTRDTHAIKIALEEVRPRSGRRGGSLIGDAIRLSEEALAAGEAGHKAIILLSDGEDMGSYPAEAAAAAAEAGISIWTIGLGDAAEGGRIPVEVDGQRIFLTHEGQEVWSRMDASILTAIAEAADGRFIPAGVANLDLADIYNQIIAPAAGRRVESARLERGVPRYRWFVGIALACLASEGVLGLRRRRTSRHAKPGAAVQNAMARGAAA